MPPAPVTRLRPRSHERIAETLQLALELPISEAARAEISDAIGRYAERPVWSFVMLSPQQLRDVLRLINGSPRPATTLKVWTAALTRVEWGTGEILASAGTLAKDAETTAAEASRALNWLADQGALIKLRPGRFMLNPRIAWNGPLSQREALAARAPSLRLID